MPTPAHLSTIDSTLLALSTKAFTLTLYLKLPELAETTTDQESIQDRRQRLRESMVGYHLQRIAAYAEGETHVTPEAAQESIRFMYKLLFEHPFVEDTAPSQSFHRTELGRMIAEATIRLTAGMELLTPTQAYQELHTSRQAIYNFVRDGKLNPLYLYGKMMLFAHEVEALKVQREQVKLQRQAAKLPTEESMDKESTNEQNYYTLDFKLGDEISFTEASLDSRYEKGGFQNLTSENGPYYNYKVVDFPDSESRFYGWARIGVRKDAFNGQAPLYYVRCKDVIDRKLRVMSQTIIRSKDEHQNTGEEQ